jgi:hypothetical protein
MKTNGAGHCGRISIYAALFSFTGVGPVSSGICALDRVKFSK